MIAASHSMAISGSGEAPVDRIAIHSTSSPSVDQEARRMAAAIARGDELAFRELYNRYHGRLSRLALVLARGNQTLAAEAVQGAFITAAQKLRSIESEAHLWNWLARVTRQQVGKLVQRNDPATSLVIADPAKQEPADHNAGHLEATLDQAILALAEEDRQLIEWFYFEHQSHKAIAGRLNLTPKAVSSRLERARQRLRTVVRKLQLNET